MDWLNSFWDQFETFEWIVMGLLAAIWWKMSNAVDIGKRTNEQLTEIESNTMKTFLQLRNPAMND